MSYNYSMVKAFAAIGQILYGSFQLYKSAAGNIAYYGYEAYELTIIPYIVMSFLNLVASLCEPQFPAIFLVDREPDIRTAVTPNTSAVVGIIPLNSPTKARSIFNIRAEQSPVRAYFAVVACTILAVGSITTPYLVIWSMTKFKAGTRQQKEPPALFASWVMLWLVNA
ncbi:hypothetical protein Q9L58_006078 [Maublancomyces gigas]|uniref:Uncharacterized protein n=1 Tax=Discina gigas TaxID=1032678 RepID=A0ABR3GGQ1_9PEZI